MQTISSYRDAERFFLLYSPKQSGRKYSLDTIREMMMRLGNPHDKLKIIHVAGTSGKTSTSYFIRALLHEAGLTTGLLVSPHIENIAERAQVNGGLLPETKYCTYVREFKALVEAWDDIVPSYFELTITFAYWLFAKLHLDYAVIETGMGGRLDATNVAQQPSKISVITPIGFDHMKSLGNTLEEIASQKAGIIHAGNEAYISNSNRGLAGVFEPYGVHWQATYDVPIFLPHYQSENWQLARTVFDALCSRDNLPALSESQLENAAHNTPPGRYETYTINNKTIILDGAHNPQKLEAFIASLPHTIIGSSTWILGFTAGHETRLNDCLPMLAKLHVPVLCTDYQVGQDFRHRRGYLAVELAERCRSVGIEALAEPDTTKALDLALESNANTIIITGSLYLISCIRPLVKERSVVK